MLQKRKNHLDKSVSTHDLCLQVAEHIIAEQGVYSLTLKSIAEEVGIKLPSIYAHFSGITAIQNELAAQLLRSAIAQYEQVKDLPADIAILKNTQLNFEYFSSRPGMARLCLTDFATPSGHCSMKNNTELMQTMYNLLEQILNRGVKEGKLNKCDYLNFDSMRTGAILTSLSLGWIRNGNNRLPKKLKNTLLKENLSLVKNYICIDK